MFHIKSTHVIVAQVFVGVLEAVVDDADADSSARIPHVVDGHDVQAQVG